MTGVTKGKAYFVGIAGMGMTPLAIYAAGAGWQVSGCDDGEGAQTLAALETAGVDVLAPGVLPEDIDLLVISSAIDRNHPLRLRADALGIETLRRGEFLAKLACGRKLFAVVGSHGKTTTCGMLIDCLISCGIDFGYILGGLFSDARVPPARYSSGEWLIAEVDESDGTIDGFSPEITLVVNLDWDHPDRYPNADAMTRTFRRIIGRTVGRALLPTGVEPGLFDGGAEHSRVETFGEGGDFSASLLRSKGVAVTVALSGLFPSTNVQLSVGGAFNVRNAIAALAGCVAICGRIPDQPLAGFQGIFRRQDLLYSDEWRLVVADYAHHPNEIRELVGYLRESFPGKLRVVFQPHRYSRTRQYAADFARALGDADEVLLLPVYAASERHLAGGDSAAIRDEMAALGYSATLCDNAAGFRSHLGVTIAGEREVIAFIGAGDINEVAVEWLTQSLGAVAGRRAVWL